MTGDANSVHELRIASLSSDERAPLFVLLHGFGASVFTWRDLVGPLSSIGEIWAYDRPGFGRTNVSVARVGTNPYSVDGQVEFLADRVAQLRGKRPVVVIGHSSGGQIATYFAAGAPELVDGLVLISPALRSAGIPAAFEKLMRGRFWDAVGPKLIKNFDKVGMKILFDSVHDKSVLTDEMVAGYRAPMDDSRWTNRFWEFLRTAQPRDQKLAIAAVKCRALIVSGDDDRIIPVAETRENAARFAEARLIEMVDAGHLSFEERPEEFLALIRANLGWLLKQVD